MVQQSGEGSIGSSYERKCGVNVRIRWDSPLNLSILVSGGKETNQDSPSSCERTGKSPAPNPGGLAFRDMWCSGGFAYLIPSHRVQVHLERGHGPERVPGP
ncbi:hypothetical protein GE061_020213 [Apolygus lucorum]|uniref:Uncharacterized protein n=1 Tax=Apolygus lucorum TaxID=248454 RepID=A0A6A4JQN7_APOLU|nr:hypothetical protein GE061_020213 [Apolygus lucorum]